MADSIEKIADEIMRQVQSGPTVDWRPNMTEIATRLRALSPAGGGITADWVVGYLPMYADADTRKAVRYAFAEYEALLAASPQQEPGAGELCKTCGGHGVVCYHTGQTPEQYEEHTEDCPECTPSGQTLAGAGGDELCFTCRNPKHEGPCGEPQWGSPKMCDKLLSRALTAEKKRTATSAGTTGDDSEDAARYRWLRTCGVADDRAIHTRGYSELLSESELDAAIDARRAREV